MSDEKKNIYSGRDVSSLILLDIKYEGLLERIRLIEDAILRTQSAIYRIDEDYQLAKHKKRIACMCCPFLHKSKKC